MFEKLYEYGSAFYVTNVTLASLIMRIRQQE
jgi:hypothetical protein